MNALASRGPRVEVADLGADACLYSPADATPVLYIRPGQSFESAVRAVQAALDHADDEVARGLVFKHAPELRPLEDLFAQPSERVHPWLRIKAGLSLRAVLLVVVLLMVAWAMVQIDMRHEISADRHATRGALVSAPLVGV